MNSVTLRRLTFLGLRTSVLAGSVAALLLTGCKTKPALSDNALASTVQTQLAADGALAGQSIQTGVQGGVVTLTGSVADATQRLVAARDAAAISGVKEVVNDLSVASGSAPTGSVTTAPLPAVPAASIVPTPARIARAPAISNASRTPPPAPHSAPIERRPLSAPAPSYAQNQPQAPPPPPPPPPPTFRTVTVQAGRTIPVRVTQTLDSASSQVGDNFSGVVASDVVVDGAVAIPAGSTVNGSVTEVKDASHFKGSSLLTVSLNSVSRRGERLPVAASPYSLEGKGRGVNTAEKTGGGAAVGAILGGIFGGGKGAAIGAAAGGGVGAGSNAVTRGQQVTIPSESVIRFQLTAPVTVRVRADGETRSDGGLQTRQ
jgi:hypothetical protein